jgi:exoribonuclease R
MLPAVLSEQLCSINRDVDRYAMSIILTFDASHNLRDRWVGRTVIRSVARLNYDTAYSVITAAQRGEVLRDYPPPFVPVREDLYEPLSRDLSDLNAIAKSLKARRVANGAVSLNLNKLAVIGRDGDRLKIGPYPRNDAHFLVEEFMILANCEAARFTSAANPQGALVRRHMPPNFKKIEEVRGRRGLKG